MPQSRTAPFLTAAFLALLAALAGLKMCRDVAPDVFWQLKDGERIVREWRLPVREDYSFTASGKPLVATEWLAEAVAYVAFRAAGYGGLVALHAALFLLTFILLLALIRRRLAPLASLCLLSLCAFAFVNFYHTKAQNWTFLFTALFLYWADLWEGGNEGVAWAMSGALLVWARTCTEGSWSAGPSSPSSA